MTKRKPFEEVYPIKDTYKRFDSRNTSFAQSRRRRQSEGLGYADDAGKVERMNKGIPGFSIVDYAFKDAAETYTGRGMNTGYYSWTSLGVATKPEGVPRWEVSPEEAAKVVKKAAKFYGATTVGFTETDKRWFYSNLGDGRPRLL